MYWWTSAMAAGVWLLGRLVLGNEWKGIEVAPGVWRDSVALAQWAVFWLLLAIVGLVAGPRVPRWTHRLAVPVPFLGWLAWALWSPLGPIPLAVYGVPSVLVWCLGGLAGDAARQLARSVKHRGA